MGVMQMFCKVRSLGLHGVVGYPVTTGRPAMPAWDKRNFSNSARWMMPDGR